jgi:hypothetical protein
MKTNQVMTVSFAHGDVVVGHKEAMFEINHIFSIGNKYRVLNNQPPLQLSAFINSKRTQEFLMALAAHTGLEPTKLLYVTGRGVKARTMGNMHLMIYAAEFLSPAFHVEVIDTFINSKLLTYRDESGDAFKKLMEVIKETAEPILGKPPHHGHYITVSKIIMGRFPASLDWNIATAEQLKERTRIEEAVTTAIRMGFIKDWEHLKQVIIEI